MADPRRHVRRLIPLWAAAALLFLLPAAGLTAESFSPVLAAQKKLSLFGSVEFPGSLRALKKWTGIIAKARAQTDKLATCDDQQASCKAIARSWQQMLGQARTLKGPEQLNWVNRFFNRWPYRLDMEIYGVSDYWATPEEFMRYSGDCEDYSIAKYFALRQLGYPLEQLRIVVLHDSIRNIGHAVLAVYREDDAYILDNMSNQVLSHRRYQHYSPYYSLNENNRWAHGQLPRSAQTMTQP